jgi:ribosomal protein S18 acetylase RimI-like enzyme
MAAATAMAWRPAAEADLPAILGIAAALHAEHPERPEVFAERLRLAPPGFCRVLARGPSASALLGYALTHPWRADHPPALDAQPGAPPAAPDAWHIHDVALLPAARGRGLADAVLREIEAGAVAAPGGAGLLRATLVAVAGKAGYWRRRGFRAVSPGDGGATLATYGAGAVFMARDLGRP